MNVKVIYRERGRDSYTDVPHTHERDYELIHVLSGKGNVFMGERVIPFCGEAVFLLDAAVLHYVSPDADVPYVRTKLLLDKTLTAGAVAPLLAGGHAVGQKGQNRHLGHQQLKARGDLPHRHRHCPRGEGVGRGRAVGIKAHGMIPRLREGVAHGYGARLVFRGNENAVIAL